MEELNNKTYQELRSLTITQVQWIECYSIGFTLSDGQTYRVGTLDCEDSHTFDPQKKITKVVCKYGDDELRQIKFYCKEEKLVGLGISDEEIEEIREEDPNILIEEDIFEIADDEQLIGCEIDHFANSFLGVTWLKMKLY